MVFVFVFGFFFVAGCKVNLQTQKSPTEIDGFGKGEAAGLFLFIPPNTSDAAWKS